jgi:hypothetical protein
MSIAVVGNIFIVLLITFWIRICISLILEINEIIVVKKKVLCDKTKEFDDIIFIYDHYTTKKLL